MSPVRATLLAVLVTIWTLLGLPWRGTSPGGAGSAADLATREPTSTEEDTTSVIVQGRDLATASEAVRSVGGEITHELGIIDAVAADLTPAQQRRLARLEGGYRVYADRLVETSGRGNGGGSSVGTHPVLVAADQLHAEGIDGGVVRRAGLTESTSINTWVEQE